MRQTGWRRALERTLDGTAALTGCPLPDEKRPAELGRFVEAPPRMAHARLYDLRSPNMPARMGRAS